MANFFKNSLYIGILKRLPNHKKSSEDYYFLAFTIPAIICLVCLMPLLSYSGLWRPAWSSGLSAIILCGLLLLWRWGVSIAWLQCAYQSTLMWLILYNAYFTGGVASPVMVWMGIVPLLPMFTISRKWSYVWLIISFASVVFFYWAQIYGLIPNKSNINHEDLTLSALMIGLMCLTQAMLVITYDSANAQHIQSIERNNSALKNLSEDLQLAHDHKDKFLATVSHEMRTPLNALMGYLGLLRTTEQMPTVAMSYLQGAQNSAAHLLTVINDLLDFSQIQQGKLVLSPQSVDLHKVLIETHETMAPKAASQALGFSLQLENGLPQWVFIDPHRLTQIFLNLLGNALKFTHSGSVTTQVRFVTSSEDKSTGMLILIVHDTGIGISDKNRERIFEPFVQIHSDNILNVDNALRGNGLGLSITKNLISNFGGSIQVDSQMNVGSTFEVRLPIKIAEAPQIRKLSKISEVHENKIYLLLVDDHATNRLVTSATIKRDLPNAIIDEAKNGTEAIQKMKINRYDLVLMDLIMPDLSGVEVTRIIRSECAAPYCSVNVIALTANVAEAVVEDCLVVGISEVLRKPFDREVLIRSILQHAEPSRI